jgi:hypothetical protein
LFRGTASRDAFASRQSSRALAQCDRFCHTDVAGFAEANVGIEVILPIEQPDRSSFTDAARASETIAWSSRCGTSGRVRFVLRGLAEGSTWAPADRPVGHPSDRSPPNYEDCRRTVIWTGPIRHCGHSCRTVIRRRGRRDPDRRLASRGADAPRGRQKSPPCLREPPHDLSRPHSGG